MAVTLNETPSANRLHIGIFGKTNSGKSSFINAFSGQKVSIVADVAGTTTDPVYKAMEIYPLGPCVLIDTAGFDDKGDVDFVFCGSYACPDSFSFPSIWLCFRGRCSAKCSEQSSLLDRRTANVLYRSALDRSLGDYAVLSFSIVSVSEFGYPNCSQHILSALLPVVADHLSYDFRQPVFSSARHCFL